MKLITLKGTLKWAYASVLQNSFILRSIIHKNFQICLMLLKKHTMGICPKNSSSVKTGLMCSSYTNSTEASKSLRTLIKYICRCENCSTDPLLKTDHRVHFWPVLKDSCGGPVRVTHKHHLMWQDIFFFYIRWRTRVSLPHMNVTIGSHLVFDCWKLVCLIVLKVWRSRCLRSIAACLK